MQLYPERLFDITVFLLVCVLRITETILEAIIMHQPEIDRNGKVNIVIKVALVIDEIHSFCCC